MVKVAIIQDIFKDKYEINIKKILKSIKKAVSKGGLIIVLPELPEGIYFCEKENDIYFDDAKSKKYHPFFFTIKHLAKLLNIVVILPFFEKKGSFYFNSVSVIDSNGENLGIYRKSNIPTGPGYEEKFFFKNGNTGVRVWQTNYGKIGVGICWDQWFPEISKSMVLMGADILIYPTAIGIEPTEDRVKTRTFWQRSIQGQSISNVIPVVIANRVDHNETGLYYGHTFVTNHFGKIIAEVNEGKIDILYCSFNFKKIKKIRGSYGFFRDRRNDLYI